MPKRRLPGTRGEVGTKDALKNENEELRAIISQLKVDLDNERGSLRQCRREKATEVKAAIEHEQRKYSILLGDIRTKLRHEKIHELDAQKDMLMKRYDNEIQVLMKQREQEVQRLRSDLRKVQNDYEMASQQVERSPTKKRKQEPRNGSPPDRASPDAEELRKSKRQLEDAYGLLLEADKQKTRQLKKMKEYHRLEMSKVKKEVNQDVRKLVDELGSKDRVIKQLEKELNSKSANQSTETGEPANQNKAKSNGSSKEANGNKEEGTLSTREETERRYMNKITDLNSKVGQLEEKCGEFMEEKTELLKKNKELEKRLRPMQEKNRKFLQRNMELTTVNRCLEDKVKKLYEDNQKMKSQVEDIKRRSERLLQELNQEKMERVTLTELTEKVEDSEREIKQLNQTISSLKQTCSEKDRRINLLKHRQKRARENRPRSKQIINLQESGFEEIGDCRSLDSSWSSSVSNNTSLAEDDTWDEFAREEFEANYRRLIREHLELEKSYGLLQTQTDSHLDPERGGKQHGQLLADLLEAHSKIEDLERVLKEKGQAGKKSDKRRQLPDIAWIEEKQLLSSQNQELIDRVKLLEAREAKAHRELREAQEQHEIMEFRVLELEEIVEKLQRQAQDVSSVSGVPTEDDDDIEISVLDLLEIDMVQLQHDLLTVKYKHDGALSRPEKTVLLQAKVMLEIADKRLKASQTTETALKDRIRDLEHEKTKLLQDAGVNPDLVIEYEDTRNKLLEAGVQIEQLEDEVKDLKEQDAVHTYTEDAYAKREDKFKKEIDDLRKQLRSALEGRTAETALVDERAGKFSDYQKKSEEWEKMVRELSDKVRELEHEKDQIRLESLAASDPEIAKILGQLRDQLIEKDKQETELLERCDQLELDLDVQKQQNSELEKINGEVTQNYYDIKSVLEDARADINRMKSKIKGEDVANSDALEKIAQLEKELEKLREKSPSANDLDLDNQRLRVECIKLEDEVKSKEKDLNSKLDELEKLKKEFKSVDDENTVLRNKFFEKSQSDKTDVPRLKVQIKAKEYEIQQLKEKQAELEKVIEELKAEPVEEGIVKAESEGSLHAAPGMTPDQLSDSQKTNLEKKITDLEDAEAELKERCEDLQNTENDLKANVDDLLNQLKKAQDEVKAAEEEKKDLQEKADKEKAELEDEAEELRAREKQLQQKLQDFVQDADQYENNMKEDLNALKDKSQSLEMKNLDLTELVSQAEFDKDKLRSQVKNLENQVKEAQETADSLQEKIEDIKEQNYEKLGKLQEELDNYRENERKLSESLVEAEQTEEHLRDQLKRYEGPNSELAKVDSLRQQISDLEKENSQLNMTVDDLEAKLRAAQEYSDECETKYQEEVKDLEEEIGELQKQRMKQLREFEQNENDLHDQLVAEAEKAEALQDELAKAKREKDELNQALKTKDEEMEDLISDYETKLDRKDAQIARDNDSVRELEDLLEKQGTEGDTNLKKVMELREELEGKDTLVMDLEDKVSEVENDLQKLQGKKEEVEQEVQALQDELDQLKANRAQQEKFIGELKADLEHELEERLDKERALEELREEVMQDREALQEKDQLLEELDRDVAEEREANRKTGVEMLKLKDALENESKQGAKIVEVQKALEAKDVENEKLQDKLRKSEDNLHEVSEECAKSEEKVAELQGKIAALRNELLDSERFSEDLKDENEALKKRVSEMRELVTEKSDELMRLEEDFEQEREKEKNSRKELQDRINVLRNSEEKLLQRILQLEESERDMRDALESDDLEAEQQKDKIHSLESQVANLKRNLSERETQLVELGKENSAKAAELESVNKHMKLSDDSEAKLMEILADTEKKETQQRQDLAEAEEQIADLEEKVELLESNEKDLRDHINDLEQVVGDLESVEKDLKDEVNTLKQSEDLLKRKVEDLENAEQDLLERLAVAQLDSSTREGIQKLEAPVFEEAILPEFMQGAQSAPGAESSKGRLTKADKDRLRKSLGRKTADELVNRILELTDMQHELVARLADMEDSSMDRSRTESVERELDDFGHREQRYKDTISRLQREIEHLTVNGAKSTDSSGKQKPEDYKERLDNLHSRLDSFITKSEAAHRHPVTHFPKTTDISDLPEDELISKIQNLELGDISNKRKIGELEDCIKIYRQVVETVAFAMATDLEGLNLDLEKKELMSILGRKETGYEGKLQELINSESAYKKQLIEMERREALLKGDLLKAETELNESMKDNNKHIQELEDKISQLEQSEAKLRSKLQFGTKDRTTDTLSKIHDLKDRIIDLEAAEKQLRRTVHDLQIERDDLRQKVAEHRDKPPSTPSPIDRLRELEHQQEIDELQAKLRQMEASERTLQDQLLKLRSQDNTGLLERIEHLERSERALQRKLEMYESHDLDDESDTLMDKPEDLLRQRIHELEKMEKHLRSQITDLENDREELHEMARKDKSVIHELNVKRRELQLSEKNLKEQVNMFEVTENNLLAKIDAMQDELDDLEDQLSRVKRAEKNWKGQAKELKFTEESAAKKAINLEGLLEDLQSSETKLKKNLYTSEQETLTLKDKVETLQEQLYDLQSNEIALKQRIRDLENRERALQCDLAKFECSENVATRRSGDLESLTDSLSERIYALEEERANLKYEVSDLAVVYEDVKKQVALLENNELTLKQQIEYLESNEKRLQKRNQELELQRIDLLRKADDAGHGELKQKEKVQVLERSEKKLKHKLQELENNAASLERGSSKIKDLEKENTNLQDELYEASRKIQRMEKVIKTLEDKQRQADLNRSRGGTALITRQELAELRSQVGQLEETERRLAKVEKNEVNLKETIAQLRRGKNACGHEQEIDDMKNQLTHYQNLLREREYELLCCLEVEKEKASIEEKYNNAREELRILQDSLKSIKEIGQAGYQMKAKVAIEDGDVIVAVKKRDRSQDQPPQDRQNQTPNDRAPVTARDTPHTAPPRQRRPIEHAMSVHELDQITPEIAHRPRKRPFEPLPENGADEPDIIETPDISEPYETKPFDVEEHDMPEAEPLENIVPQKSEPPPVSKEEALEELAKALRPYDVSSDEEVMPTKLENVQAAPTDLSEDEIVPTEHKKAETQMNFSDILKDSEPKKPQYQESPRPSKPGSRRVEKRRPRSQEDGDESDSSSLDEHPVAGMNVRRTSNMFDFQQNGQPPESDQWRKVERQKTHDDLPEQEEPFWRTVEQKHPTEDLTVTMNLSDDDAKSDDEKQTSLPPPNRFSDPSHYDDSSEQRPSRLSRHHRKGSYDTDSGISTMPDPHHPHRSKTSPTQEHRVHERMSPVHQVPTRDVPYDRHSPLPPGDIKLSPWLTQHLIDQKSISTSTEPMLQSVPQQAWPDGPQRTIATDTTDITRRQNDEIAQLRNKIDDLETELRIKTRELETSHFLQRELEEKVKTTEDPYAWKSRLREKDRDIDVQERMNRSLFEENARLERDLIAKQRQINELEAEIDNLDQVLKTKESTDNSETVQKLKKELDRIQSQLELREQERVDLETKLRTLSNQNERKEKDLETKTEKIDEIHREMRRCQDALKEAETAKLKSVGDLRNAEIDLTRLKDADKKLQKLREEHHDLQVHHAELKNELRKLERAKKERDELENVVDELKKRIQDYDQIRGERADLELKVKLLEEQLEHKTMEADTLSADRQKLREQKHQMEREIQKLTDKLQDYNHVKARYDEMEKIKDRAERAVAPLRAKVMRLAQQCKEKDDVIRRLADDLKHSGRGNPGLMDEVDNMRADMAQEEYNRPLSPIGGMSAFDDDAYSPASSKKSPYSPRGNDNPNVDQVLHNDLYDDNQSDIIPTRLSKQEHAPPSMFADSLYDPPSRIPRPTASSPLNNQRSPRHPPKKEQPETNCYFAVADYDPTNFSRSGHPRLELPLKEGDVVQVFGSPDDKGYFEAEVNGRTGLVPGNYLQPMTNQDSQTPKKRKPKKISPSHVDSSPEHILDMHNQLEHAHIPTHDASSPCHMTPEPTAAYSHREGRPVPMPAMRPPMDHPSKPARNAVPNPVYIPIPSHGCTEILPTTIIRDVSQPNTLERGHQGPLDHTDGPSHSPLPRRMGPPEPPSDFHIERILSDHNVMVEWQPPPMDELDRNNGVQISGYKISVDGVECHRLSSPHLTKALIGRLDLHVPHKLSIQSYTTLGDVSRSEDTYFQDVLPDSRDGMSDLGDNFDGGSVASSNFYESGERRKFMAIYDYNPAEQSPNTDPVNELAFKTGDVIFTYGPLRPDGFYHSKIRGRKGLVPASFIEEMPQSSRKSKKSHSRKAGSTSSKGSDHFSPRDRKPSKHHEAEPARLY